MLNNNERFWTERSVPGSPSWPFFRGRTLSRYHFAYQFARGKRVLDVACGTGHGAHLLATEGGAAEVVGVDVSDEAVSCARENYSAPNTRYLHGDAQRLPELGVTGFGLVTSMGTLEHVENPDLFAKHVMRALEPGGVWMVTMLNPAAHQGMDPYHFQEWNAGEFRQFLERNGLQFEIRWHVMLPASKEKIAHNKRRYAFLPEWVKTAVKKAIGRQAALEISKKGAVFCEPEDFAWSTTPDERALEFMAICRKVR